MFLMGLGPRRYRAALRPGTSCSRPNGYPGGRDACQGLSNNLNRRRDGRIGSRQWSSAPPARARASSCRLVTHPTMGVCEAMRR